ncbi:hypothetical protein F4809DRAFT_380486 [Biscogniauxia mediterranea]|nr:hypothetical protein F4809DRAFT_380486 [Biscogniauxia mediterranea]
MEAVPTPLRVAAGAGIMASVWAAGIGTSLSLFSIPTILGGGGGGGAPRDVMLRQWKFHFLRGRALMPGLAALNAANYWIAAYARWSRGLEWRGLAAAGASTFFIIPYTVVFMFGTNERLMAAADGKEEEEEKEKPMSEDTVRRLIKKWGELNVVRAVVPLVGSGLALWNLCLL